MKFDYPDLTATPFKGMRFYETPKGKFYPSVTTVLGGTMPEEKAQSLKKWQMSLGVDLAQKKTQEAADRGTAVHLMAERYLKKEPLNQGENFSAEHIASFNALKLKLNKVEEIWGQEVALYTDLLEMAGRADLIGVYKGIPSIIDFKTSTRIKNSHDVDDYRLQLTAYAVMHNELFGTDIEHGVILITSAGGFPQEFNVDLRDYVAKLANRVDEFYAKLSTTV
jgi:ATP-dependent exoDNAse (exonuclease V) beta subunit